VLKLSSSFVTSERIINIISMSQVYSCKPSEVIGDLDSYTAFCFDEACAFILNEISGDGTKDSGKVPVFRRKVSSFRELYAKYQ